MRLQMLQTPDAARDAAICEFVKGILPKMSAVMRERQPDLVPGAVYTKLNDTEKKNLSVCPVTTDTMESEFSKGDYVFTGNPSMLLDTASTM